MIDDQRRREQIADLFRDAAKDLVIRATVLTGGNRAAAEDLVQEVFVDASKSWAKIEARGLSGQRAWLYVTLRNKVVDLYRRGRFEVSAEPSDLEVLKHQHLYPVEPTRGDLPAAVLDKCWEVIKQMPKVRRQVIVLRALEWTTAEIAKDLQVTQSTVRDHYGAATKQLNEYLEGGRKIVDDLAEGEFEDGAER